MGSWLRSMQLSRATDAVAGVAAVAVASRAPVGRSAHGRPFVGYPAAPRCEPLEGRFFLSAAPLDLTNAYGGSVTFKVGKVKVKETISLTLTSQTAGGVVGGQIASAHVGTVDLKGKIDGKTVTLVGTTSGRLIEAKIGKKGKSLSGTVLNGADDTLGKFKLKIAADAPPSVPAAPANSGARARALAANPTAADAGGLDPSIDPATGLPIDPVTGLPIDPSLTPGEGDGGGIPTAPGLPGGTPIPQAAPGDLIGNNYSILGVWSGDPLVDPALGFNYDGSGSIADPADPQNTTAVNGTTPGTDPRSVTFTTTSQDDTGLVAGTLDIVGFGTFVYTGFVNNLQIDLVLSGSSTGAVSGTVTATLDATTFDRFVGTLSAEANGFQADGPIAAAFVSDTGTSPPGGSTDPLPAGQELYSVAPTDADGEQTAGNFDPNGATLGEDFAVGDTPIIINSLGAFDADADGLMNTIRVAIYNTNNPGTPVVVQDITTATSRLADGSSFRYLTTFTPVTLTLGVYRIVAVGYGGGELAGDIGVDNYVGGVPVANTGTAGEIQYPVSNTLNANNWRSAPVGDPGTGGGIAAPLVYPTQAEGLPLNRYLAGSALFELGTPVSPPPGPPVVPPPPPVLTKPANSAYPGGVYNSATGPEVFGSQSDPIIP